MANFWYTAGAADALGAGSLVSSTFKALLLEENSDVNKDDDTITAVLARAGTTEIADTNYARQDLAYTGTTNQAGSLTKDDTNDWVKWISDNVVFGSTPFTVSKSSVGIIIFRFVTNDDDSIPYFHLDAVAAGTTITVQPATNGWTTIASA